MVDVVGGAFAVVDAHHLPDDLDEVIRGQDPDGNVRLKTQALVDLVAANFAQVIPSEVEEQAVEETSRVIGIRRIAWPQPSVELQKSFFRIRSRVLVERGLD